ncbi:MAG: 3-mercaptopyruvate sulfurtransferase [Alphaproteobacteria bacterium]
MAMTAPLVSTAWLAERLGDPDILIVDGSWWMPAEARSGEAEFLQRHIPGAVFFDIDAIADKTVDLPHMLPTPEVFADAVGELGLGRDATIVVYDTFGIRAAARVWWELRAMGFEKLHVLDGGLKTWIAEGRPLETGPAEPRPVSVAPNYKSELVRNSTQVLMALESGTVQVVDARAGARFRGEAPEPRAGLRSGHMPGALNTPFDTLLNADGTLKSPQALRDVFQLAGVDLDAPIITTCGSGVTASVIALALATLGKDAAVYDGSWTEWGGLADMPVVTGA